MDTTLQACYMHTGYIIIAWASRSESYNWADFSTCSYKDTVNVSTCFFFIVTFRHSTDTIRSRERRGKPGFAERSRERRASETAERD